MKERKSRILLVSDMHYTTDESQAALASRYPDVQVSLAAGSIFGISQTEKVAKLRSDLLRECDDKGVDAVIVLGDLSIDDYGYRNLPENYCLKLKQECLDLLPCPSIAIPGNHDCYPDEIWKRMFGDPRQFVYETKDAVFLMLDTFARIEPSPRDPASGSGRTVADSCFLRENLEKYKGRNIILCAHYLDENSFTPGDRELIARNPDVKLLFCGHTHIHAVREVAGKPLVDIGGYGYNGMALETGYTFQIFDRAWAWGYQILEITEDEMSCYHVRTDQHYEAANGTFDCERQIEEPLILAV